jgi:hypothetical protein
VLSKAQVEQYITDADLSDEGAEQIRNLHKHKKEYIITKQIAVAQSIYGTTKARTLKTHGTLVPARSSKLRHARRAQREVGGTRNIAVQKLEHKTNPAKKIYLGSFSMGLGHEQMQLVDEPDKTTAKGGRKRSHSEAMLVGAWQVGTLVDQHNKKINLADYEPVHAMSTNEFCTDQPGQQNCHEHLAPKLTANKTLPAYIANAYSGSDDSGVFQSVITGHDRRKRKKVKPKKGSPVPPQYDSEPESEDDSTTPLYWINTEKQEGGQLKNFKEIEVKEIFRNDSFTF